MNNEPEQKNGPESPFPPRENFTPIFCSRCGSLNLAFVTEYHKCLGARICQLLLAGIILFAVLTNIGSKEWDDVLIVSFFSLALIFFIQIAIIIAESKTHVQCVCRDCGNVWLHT